MSNKQITHEKSKKRDALYTTFREIQQEIGHYTKQFYGKTVFCHCDDLFESDFCLFFLLNFKQLALKRLICTSYRGSPILARQNPMVDADGELLTAEHAYVMDVCAPLPLEKRGTLSRETPERLLRSLGCVVKTLKGDGDFRSVECVQYLQQADLVVTAPPPSLFREYVSQLMAYDKKFLIVGTQVALTDKAVFSFIREDRMWIGMHFGEACWYTNLELPKRHAFVVLLRHYRAEAYPKYDQYNAINIDQVCDIPMDYEGVMGVPIAFLNQYNPDQFEILGLDRYMVEDLQDGQSLTIRQRKVGTRVLIRHKGLDTLWLPSLE